MRIEDELFPENGKLIVDKEGTCRAQIIDAEIDPIDCSFHYDECVQINTKDLTYITLSIDNLYELIELIEQSEKYYDEH